MRLKSRLFPITINTTKSITTYEEINVNLFVNCLYHSKYKVILLMRHNCFYTPISVCISYKYEKTKN